MEEIKEMSEGGRQKLIGEEGLVRRPYLDSVKVPTIGVGMTYYPLAVGTKIKAGQRVSMKDDPLSLEDCMRLFKAILKPYELAVYSMTRDDINQNQFDALVMLCYNIGTHGFKGSTLVRRINKNLNDVSGITLAFLMWSKAGNNPSLLLARRKREAAFFFTTYSVIGLDDAYVTQTKMVQRALKLTPDGIFGRNTKDAVIAFQKSKKLVPDGIVGPATLAHLNKL